MTFLHAISEAVNVGDEDIIHRAMKWQIALLPLVMIWALILETLFVCGEIKSFDIQTVFSAVLFYEGGVATLLTSGTASLFFRKTTSSEGSTTETEEITKGKQPDTVTIDKTTIIK